jgi:hypothetical protein
MDGGSGERARGAANFNNWRSEGSSPRRSCSARSTSCRWGDIETGLPILTAGLKSRQRAVQLHAAHALEKLGEQARPLLPRLKQLATKSSEFVQRITAHTVEQLEGRE